MVQHLKLPPKRAYEGGTLNGLGKITVICGKNNGGKSTILEAIADKAAMAGKVLSAEEIGAFTTEALTLTGWGGHDFRLNSILTKHIETVLDQNKVWYQSDEVAFHDAYQNKPQQLQSYGLNIPRNFFRGLFTEKLNVALITAKRKIETNANVNASGVAFDATGILSELYWLKNKSEGTSERESYEAILRAFFELSDGYLFDITQDKSGNIHLVFSNDKKNWHLAPNCGLGLHELLILLFFCHASNYDLILVEEIENHLHPHMQKKLLRHLSTVKAKQFVLSTHSSAFLDTSLVDAIYFVENKGQVIIREVTNRAEVLKNLGYSITDNIVSDLIILVEGPTDTPVIEEFLAKKELIPRFDIKIWALGGDIMHFHDLEVFKQNYRTMALIDNDHGSTNSRKAFLAKCAELNIPAYQLRRYSIENYFSIAALRKVFGSQLPDIAVIDPNKKLEEQIGINVKLNNRKIAKAMVLEEIQKTDFDEFLNRVKAECETNTV